MNWERLAERLRTSANVAHEEAYQETRSNRASSTVVQNRLIVGDILGALALAFEAGLDDETD